MMLKRIAIVTFTLVSCVSFSQEENQSTSAKIDSIYHWIWLERYPDSILTLKEMNSDTVQSSDCSEQMNEIKILRDSLTEQSVELQKKSDELSVLNSNLNKSQSFLEKRIEALKRENEGISEEYLNQLEANLAFWKGMGFVPKNTELVVLFKKQRLLLLKAKMLLSELKSVNDIEALLKELDAEFNRGTPLDGLNLSRANIRAKLLNYKAAICYMNSVFNEFEMIGRMGFPSDEARLQDLNAKIEFDRIYQYEFLVLKYYELKETPGAYKNPLKYLKLSCD